MIIYPCSVSLFKYMVNSDSKLFLFTHDVCKWYVLFIWIFFFVPILTTNLSVKYFEWLIYPKCRDFTQSSDVMLVLCNFFFRNTFKKKKSVQDFFDWSWDPVVCELLIYIYHPICDTLLFNLSPIYWLSRLSYWSFYFLIFLGDVHCDSINFIWW